MTIERIITNRIGFRQCYWQIVYEWEDAIAQALGVGFSHNLYSLRFLRGLWRRLLHTPASIPITKRISLAFVMRAGYLDENIAGRPNVIPIIIDFWERDPKKIKEFANRYRGNPAVLITSKEVFEYIKDKVEDLRLFHWPLSLPDKCLSSEVFPRKWDCALVGRPSKILNAWVERYAQEHRDFTCVRNDRKNGSKLCNYVTSDGECLGDILATRKSYFQFLRSIKVGLYSTPGVDNDKAAFTGICANGYDQVTPRFLEYLAAGCHVVARYSDNEDTRYFELDKLAPHVSSYEEFARQMDYMRTHSADSQLYDHYLKRHVTSSRVLLLKKIIETL